MPALVATARALSGEQAVELLEGVEGEPDLDAAPVLRPGLDVDGRVRTPLPRVAGPAASRSSARFERDGGVEVSEDPDEPRDRSNDRDRPRGRCEPGREAVIAEELGHACLALRVRDGLAAQRAEDERAELHEVRREGREASLVEPEGHEFAQGVGGSVEQEPLPAGAVARPRLAGRAEVVQHRHRSLSGAEGDVPGMEIAVGEVSAEERLQHAAGEEFRERGAHGEVPSAQRPRATRRAPTP